MWFSGSPPQQLYESCTDLSVLKMETKLESLENSSLDSLAGCAARRPPDL